MHQGSFIYLIKTNLGPHCQCDLTFTFTLTKNLSKEYFPFLLVSC